MKIDPMISDGIVAH